MSRRSFKLSHEAIKNILSLALTLFVLGVSTEHIAIAALTVVAIGVVLNKINEKTKKANKFGKTPKMTPIERKMYCSLKRAGYNPIPQYQQGKYRLDFALFEKNLKLDIECDGKAYHSSPEQRAHDRKRTRSLNKEGWNVMRFSGSQIHRNIEQCVQRIDRKIKKRFNLKTQNICRKIPFGV